MLVKTNRISSLPSLLRRDTGLCVCEWNIERSPSSPPIPQIRPLFSFLSLSLPFLFFLYISFTISLPFSLTLSFFHLPNPLSLSFSFPFLCLFHFFSFHPFLSLLPSLFLSLFLIAPLLLLSISPFSSLSLPASPFFVSSLYVPSNSMSMGNITAKYYNHI